MMNAEDDVENLASQRNIYTPKYFSLMLTMIILGGTYQVKSKIDNYQYSHLDHILQLLTIIIAFLISSFSQFIGHRILYITSYTIYSVSFILIYFHGLLPSTRVLFNTSRLMLLQQIIIQIYGMWPNKFGRIFAELLIYHLFTKQLTAIIQIKYEEDLIYWIFFLLMIGVNLIWLLCGQWKPSLKSINDFKSPETDSVLQDFFRLLCNIKIIIFTMLYFVSKLSLKIFQFVLVNQLFGLKQNYSKTLILAAQKIPPILSIILVRAFVNLYLKSSVWILISLIMLVSLLITLFILFEIDYFIYVDLATFLILDVIWIAINNLQDIFTTPQYWQILLNIGIRNLDFVASYQLLAFQLSTLCYVYLVFFYSQLILDQIKNFQILILSLIGIIINLSIIFYQFLGFKKYLYNTNTSQVEEDKFQIEIV